MFTQGEWFTKELEVYGEDGRTIALVRELPDDKAEANANLISSAPDMYKACLHAQTVLYNLQQSTGELTQQEQLLEIEIGKALAKADGK